MNAPTSTASRLAPVTDTAPLSPESLRRVAAALAESGAALRRLAPQAAGEQAAVAALLNAIAAAAPLIDASPAPAPKPPRLSKNEQAGLARSWFLRREDRYHEQKPPSAAQDMRDARQEIPGVARAVIRRYRPVKWSTPSLAENETAK